MQLYVQLVWVHLLKCYHKLGVSYWVKPTQAFSHSLTYPHFIHNPTNQPLNYPQATNNLVDNYNNTITPYNLVISCTTTHNNSIIVKGFNLSSNKTLYINNIVIPQHTKKPLELKIEPCRTMLYFKAQNRLSESRSYSIDIIIKRYNITALNQTIQPLQRIKKHHTQVYYCV